MAPQQNQPLLRQIFKQSPILSYKKGKSLKDLLVRAKYKRLKNTFYAGRDYAACHLLRHHYLSENGARVIARN